MSEPDWTDDEIEAVQAIFALCEIINRNKLSIADMARSLRMAIADGHDNIEICLTMALKAVEASRK